MENNETYEAYYRVLVTEDEKPISRNICKKIEKINPKFKVTEVAYNGKQALEQIKKNTFDVLFLDINIPFFSGLDILKYITENHIHSYCVLLTGYQTFEYAQTALRYKALDYLLKPLDNAKLAEVLKKIEHLKEREKREASLSFLMNTPNRIFERENKSFKTCYVGCVLYNTLQGRLYLQKTTEQLKTSKATLNSLLAQEFKQNEYALIDGHDIVEQILLFSQDTTKLKERCHTIQEAMQKRGAICGLGINTQAKTIEQIKETYLQLRLKLSECISYKTSIFITLPYPWFVPPVDKSKEWSLKKITEYAKGLSSHATSEQVKEVLQKCLDSCDSHRKMSIRSVKTLFQYLCTNLPSNICYLNIESEILEIMENSFSIEQVYQDLCLLIEDNFYFQTTSEENKELLAQQIHDYIETNYQFAFSNQILSEKFGYVPYYLRRIFKEVYVVSPNEYIIQYRIKKSKEFLIQNLHAKDVAEIVGFSDPLYFSKVFKKIEGISPTEYVKLHTQNT